MAKKSTGRAKPLVAKSMIRKSSGHRYDCGGKVKTKKKS